MNIYTIDWKTGAKSYLKGKDISDAYAIAGYGQHTTINVDWHAYGITASHIYSRSLLRWMPFKENQTLAGYIRYDDLRNLLNLRSMYFVKQYQANYLAAGNILRMIVDPISTGVTLIYAKDTEAFIRYIWEQQAISA